MKSARRSSSGRARRSTSTAIVRVPSKPQIIRVPTMSVGRRRGGGRRRHHGGGGGGRIPIKVKGEMAAWAAALGFASVEQASLYEKIPTTGKLPREAVIGLGLHFLFKKNKHADRAAAAALSVAGFKVGEQKFQLSGDDYDD